VERIEQICANCLFQLVTSDQLLPAVYVVSSLTVRAGRVDCRDLEDEPHLCDTCFHSLDLTPKSMVYLGPSYVAYTEMLFRVCRTSTRCTELFERWPSSVRVAQLSEDNPPKRPIEFSARDLNSPRVSRCSSTTFVQFVDQVLGQYQPEGPTHSPSSSPLCPFIRL
jgi:hypothetical protein